MKKILFLLVFINQITLAQQGIDFASEDFYFLNRSQHLKISMSNDTFNIVNSVSEEAKYNTGNKLFFANEFIHFDSFTEIKDIEAFTQIPSNNSKIKVEHFETKDEFGGGVFFSDQQTINFVFPAVSKDAITTLKYKENIKDPHFLGSFRFGTYVPTKEAFYTVEVPSNVELGYKTFNLENIDISFEKKENKETTVYTWKANNIGDFRKQENSLSVLKYIPHIIVYIKNYEIENVKKPVLNDVKDLYTWYTSLINQIDKSDHTEIFSIATDLVKNSNSDKEKAKAIFNWVQSNITYVAFEDGLGGFVPRDASSVCSKRYGDCKDMANLLYEMLNHVGIEAYHTWIGTRDRPYSYYEVPTPIVDNHMITAAIIDGETIFLDATDSYVPYGMPSAFTQSKEALIGISPDDFKIIKVPVQPKRKNISLVKTTITLDDNVIHASEKRTLTGYEMVDFVRDAKYKKDEKSDEEYLNTKFKIGNNKTTYKNIEFG
ncbi:MAG: transglutaminase-like putative cysteine protease, partial [Roseivirga sp.]